MSTDVAEKPTNTNAQAEQDAENMLASLKGEAQGEDAGASNQKDTEESEAKALETKGENGAGEQDTTRDDGDERPRRHRDGRDDSRGDYRGRGTRGRGGFNKPKGRENIKSDLTSQEVSDDPVAIRKQVEFYFSDSNLPMDKFLLGKVGGSKNNPVELSILHSFKRMRRFQPFEAIVKALKDSTVLDLVEDDTAVRRKEPLPEALNDGPDPGAVKIFEDKAMPRSVYVKGFEEEQPSTQFDIEAFFATYGPTNAIRLRRTDDKLFKRSVFVEFENEELAKKFLELDPKPTFKGKDLLIMSKKEYCDKKVDDIKSGKIRPNQRSGYSNKHNNRNGRDFKRKRDNEDDRDWRERRDDDRKHGFRDDRRKNNRDRDQTGRGDRDRGQDRFQKDDRGVPVVKSTADDAKAEALANARAAVDKENQKQTATEADAEAPTKKRTRDNDDHGDVERDAKKQQVEAEA